MRYWWVNQNQTHRQELAGGYLWSPKRNANLTRNPFYETMREVAPGDVIFSFVGTRIVALGIAQSYCFESPKPAEFGATGQNWDNIGWKIHVSFTKLQNAIRPKDHIDILRTVLPSRYAPLQKNGNGLQGVYLTELPKTFVEVLGGLIGSEVTDLVSAATSESPQPSRQITDNIRDDIDRWENKLEQDVELDRAISDTDRDAIIRARRGQGLFKQRVNVIEKKCRITGVDKLVHLVASHCKPWRHATHDERLDGENGLLLTPSIDHLFDRGFIGFEDSGVLIVSPAAHRPSLERMGVEMNRVVNVGDFTDGQKRFLDFHRNSILLRAAR